MNNMIKEIVNASVTTRLGELEDEVYQSREERCNNAGLELEESLNDHWTAILAIELEKFTPACDEKLVDFEKRARTFAKMRAGLHRRGGSCWMMKRGCLPVRKGR
jgi:hypothetical protein